MNCCRRQHFFVFRMGRPLLTFIRDSLVAPGGAVIYHTFCKGCELFGRPKKARGTGISFYVPSSHLVSRLEEVLTTVRHVLDVVIRTASCSSLESLLPYSKAGKYSWIKCGPSLMDAPAPTFVQSNLQFAMTKLTSK